MKIDVKLVYAAMLSYLLLKVNVKMIVITLIIYIVLKRSASKYCPGKENTQ